MQQQPLLSLRGVTKTFGGLTAVDTVDLDVSSGQIFSIIGPNGAGKTTVFNLVTGIYKPTSGEMTFDGRSIAGLSPDQVLRRGITRTFQNIRLFNNMTVLENVLVGGHCRMRTGIWDTIWRTPAEIAEEHEARQEALALLDFIGLTPAAGHLAKNLPYGDQRRLEVARALASDPYLVLLDEPTAGMNPQETDALIGLIRRLRDEIGLTILLIEHDMRVVMRISDRVSVLDYGVKIAEGAPDQVRSDLRVIAAYLGGATPTAVH